MKLNENAMKLTNENNFTGYEFCMISYGKGHEKAMKFGVPNEIFNFSRVFIVDFIGFHWVPLQYSISTCFWLHNSVIANPILLSFNKSSL